MKKIKLTILAAMTIIMASCMNGGYGDNDATPQSAYGNNALEEKNVITIKQLCEHEHYKSVMSQYRDLKEVTDDLMLKVRVVGNDQGGNIYNKVALQDENGDAILVCVYAGGLHAYLPVGQEILIDLKGLYVGTYGYQHQIGVPYTTASGNTYPGRMPNFLWQKHFKLIGSPNPKAISCQPIDFTTTQLNDIDKYAGRLMTIKGVEITDADGKNVWAPGGSSVAEEEANTDFSVERAIKGYASSKIVVYTSTSAKFANEIIPTGKLNITGVFTRYNKVYQLQIRTLADVQPAE